MSRRWVLRVLALVAGLVALAALALLILLDRLTPPLLPVPPRTDTVIAGVTVINPGVERLGDYSIVVREGRIADLRPRLPEDPEPLCDRCYATPGLIDAHVHAPPRIAVGNQSLFALMYLAHGITTVRDLGASDESVATLAARLNAGKLVGPRMLRCGPVLDGNPPTWPMATILSDPRKSHDVVARLADEGVDCIKVYNELSREVFDAVAAAARQRGLPLVGHVPHGVGLGGLSDFEAQHMTGVPYLTLPRPPLGWDIRDEDIVALGEDDIDRALALARQQRVSFTPTLANFGLRLIASDPLRFPATPAAGQLPAYWADAWDVIAGHPSSEEAIQLRLRALPAMRALVRRAHERGIDILAGTDTIMPWVVPGEALHLELDQLRQALGGPEAALSVATTTNGRHIARGEIGTIAAGARADLLLMPQDPTQDLSALRDWRLLFSDGRLYERATVDAWMESYRRHFRGGAHDVLLRSVVSWLVDRFVHVDRGDPI